MATGLPNTANPNTAIQVNASSPFEILKFGGTTTFAGAISCEFSFETGPNTNIISCSLFNGTATFYGATSNGTTTNGTTTNGTTTNGTTTFNDAISCTLNAIPGEPPIPCKMVSSTGTSCPTQPNTTTPDGNTTATSVPKSTTTIVQPVGKIGVTNGAAAGIGIGCALAGALIVLVLLITQKKKVYGLIGNGKRHQQQRGILLNHTGSKHGQMPTEKSLSASLDSILDILPQPITHVEIEKETSRLELAIRNYVENFTDCQASSRRRYDRILLNNAQLSGYTGYKTNWETTLLNSEKRYAALRMFLARVLAARIDPSGSPESTLLPEELLRSYQIILAGQNRNKNGRVMRHIWRTMTADFASSTYSMSSPPSSPSDTRLKSMEDTVQVIIATLEPFRLKRKGSEKREHEILRDIVGKVTLLGWRFFAQNNVTEFFWSSSEDEADSHSSSMMEVFPGIRQWSGSQAFDVIRTPVVH